MNKPFAHPRAAIGGARPPRVRLRLNRRRLWRWQLWLAEALAAGGHAPEIIFVDAAPLPRAVRLLLAMERMVLGLTGEHASDPVDIAEFGALRAGAHEAAPADIVLDLADMAAGQDDSALRLTYDGVAREDALIGAMLEGRLVEVSLGDATGTRARALPAVEDPQVLTRALDNVFSTLLRLCVKSVDDPDVPIAVLSAPPAAAPASAVAAMQFAARSLAGKANAKLTQLCVGAPAWRIEWRWAENDRVALMRRLPSSGFARLADDGQRYYADPFVIERAGTHYLFCEQFDYASAKAIISVTTIAPGGTPGTPRPVLEAPHHLSYPFVFEHAGQTWMIPESSGSRTVDLYRADPFPHRWVRETTLISDVQASDATLLMQDGECWMFAATAERQSSNWDALSIFHAPDLMGPWRAHPRNPVLIDAGAARPAGRIFRSDGVLWRPAQDCSDGYGAALALCSIDRLDHDGYGQTVRARLRFTRNTRGPHTLNWAAGLEVTDCFC